MSFLPNLAQNVLENGELIADLARFSEGILTEKEKQVRRKWRFEEEEWITLNDDSIVEAVELEKTRRIRSGAAKREKAQALIVQAVDVLGGIALDPSASPKHRIDASKTLDQFADNGPASAPTSG